MPATTLNLTGDNRIEAGSTFVRTWQFIDSETDANLLTPVPNAVRASFRKTFAGALEFAADTVTVNTTGLVTMTIDSDTSAAWALAEAYANMQGLWDLELYDTSTPPVVVRLLEGTWIMTGEVTQTGD